MKIGIGSITNSGNGYVSIVEKGVELTLKDEMALLRCLMDSMPEQEIINVCNEKGYVFLPLENNFTGKHLALDSPVIKDEEVAPVEISIEEVEKKVKKEYRQYPNYVKRLDGSSVLKKDDSFQSSTYARYVRAAGCWDCSVRWKGDVLQIFNSGKIESRQVIPATKAEHDADNEGYL